MDVLLSCAAIQCWAKRENSYTPTSVSMSAANDTDP